MNSSFACYVVLLPFVLKEVIPAEQKPCVTLINKGRTYIKALHRTPYSVPTTHIERQQFTSVFHSAIILFNATKLRVDKIFCST